MQQPHQSPSVPTFPPLDSFEEVKAAQAKLTTTHRQIAELQAEAGRLHEAIVAERSAGAAGIASAAREFLETGNLEAAPPVSQAQLAETKRRIAVLEKVIEVQQQDLENAKHSASTKINAALQPFWIEIFRREAAALVEFAKADFEARGLWRQLVNSGVVVDTHPIPSQFEMRNLKIKQIGEAQFYDEKTPAAAVHETSALHEWLVRLEGIGVKIPK